MQESYLGPRYSSTHISNVVDALATRPNRSVSKEDAPLIQMLFSQVNTFKSDYDPHTRALAYDLVVELSAVSEKESLEAITFAMADALNDTDEPKHINEIASYAFMARRRPEHRRRDSKLCARNALGQYFNLKE